MQLGDRFPKSFSGDFRYKKTSIVRHYDFTSAQHPDYRARNILIIMCKLNTRPLHSDFCLLFRYAIFPTDSDIWSDLLVV